MAPSLVVLTGAGVSADSGLPTYRDAGGLWEGRSLGELATPGAWRRDPALVWRFYQERRAQLGTVAPNAAHMALAALEQRLAAAGVGFTLVTQNVDDLHERAGSSPLHLHGELARLACEGCGRSARDLEHLDPDRFVACPACARPRLRPDVVWFGEVPRELDRVAAAAEACTHFVALGTSGVVHPAAGLLALARASGAATLASGLERPDNLHPDDRFVAGRAAEVVPALCDELAGELLRMAAARGQPGLRAGRDRNP